jgi:LysM repeat protein
MSKKKPTKSVISAYRRRQQIGPFIIGGLAVLLVVGGILTLVVWLTGPNKPSITLFATKTPTPTTTFTPTQTPLPTETPTITLTPTETVTPTASAPFEYVVEEGDSLFGITQKFNLGDNGIQLMLLLNPYATPAAANQTSTGIDPDTLIVYPGQTIWIPNPDMPLPTDTPIPTGLPRGTKVTYTVKPNDTLAGIASKFNSTVDDIVQENDLADANAIYNGQKLIIPVNLVTPTATRPPTSTPLTPVATASLTPTP